MKPLDEQLHILVITYNRAACLQNTLEQLEGSPFATCAITVLDNCSTDDTPDVCKRFDARLPQLEAIRHPKNLGASPNYLRAVEMSRGVYTWIICDDDHFDFASCEDVITKLREGAVDLLHLGLLGNFGWRRGTEFKSDELAHNASHYLFVLSFVPDLIFRTELFTSQDVAAGYRNVSNLYPHFPFLAHTATESYSIYVSAERIVVRGEDHNYLSGLTWFKLWVNSCQLIRSRSLRRTAIYDIPVVSSREPLGWLKSLCACIAQEKRDAHRTLAKPTMDLFRGLSWDQFLLASCLVPLLFAPRAIFPLLWKLYNALRTSPAKPVVPVGSDFDPLRL